MWITKILSLVLALCGDSCILAQNSTRTQTPLQSQTNCVTNKECQVNSTVCVDATCRCRPGLFSVTDTRLACLASCNASNLQSSFIAYPKSNIHGTNRNVKFDTSLEICRHLCVSDKTCLTFDHRAKDNLCQLHNFTSLDVPSRWLPGNATAWTHYQRTCGNSVTSYPGQSWYNATCRKNSDCGTSNSQCLSGSCLCASGYLLSRNQSSCVPVESCVDVQQLGGASGAHTLLANNRSSTLTVWCDMDSGHGGWAVFQRRRDGSLDFYRSWKQYEEGFGDVRGEFWLGLSRLHELTRARPHRLRVDLGDATGAVYYSEYLSFRVGGPETNYTLHVSNYSADAARCIYQTLEDYSGDENFAISVDNPGSVDGCKQLCTSDTSCVVVTWDGNDCRTYSGDNGQPDTGWTYLRKTCTGDELTADNNMPFSTYDRDNDKYFGNCAARLHAAWWYGTTCGPSGLNGIYVPNGDVPAGIMWGRHEWATFTFSEMKLKPA